ncbi:MAG: hypothetical protein IJD71_01285 [Clostridia bacterium]|nr:hypothetical protein [Clostridia bacterium]
MNSFLRKMVVSAVITACILFGFMAACKAYSGIRKIGFGEYRSAIEINSDGIKVFDYTF